MNLFFSLLVSTVVSVTPMPDQVRLSDRIPDNPEVVTTVSGRMSSPEAYVIRIGRHKVRVKAGSDAGIFYAMQTLQQLKDAGELRCGVIKDSPRFAWRGFMLDESRHFFGEAYVRKLLDAMARYKLNKFHWHLTDAPGWRVEIKKYPELTATGAVGNYDDPQAPARFYTQEQIRNIVAYAAERHIEVIPEIDMPGHATAANRAYPQYDGGGNGTHPDFTFNPGKEETYSFLTDILREVCSLFPSDYIHIGGDEVHFVIDVWNRDPDIRALIKREKLSGVEDAEGYFFNRMADSLKVLGKRMIAWDDAYFSKPDRSNTTFCWWRHDKEPRLHEMLADGYPVILCPRIPLYFDFIQSGSHKVGRTWDKNYCPLAAVYDFPEALGLTGSELSSTVGIQANLWTEMVGSEDRADFMTFPRLVAMAEAAWTHPQRKSWTDFERRMTREYEWMDSHGICCFDHSHPDRHQEPER